MGRMGYGTRELEDFRRYIHALWRMIGLRQSTKRSCKYLEYFYYRLCRICLKIAHCHPCLKRFHVEFVHSISIFHSHRNTKIANEMVTACRDKRANNIKHYLRNLSIHAWICIDALAKEHRLLARILLLGCMQNMENHYCALPNSLLFSNYALEQHCVAYKSA